MVSAQYACTPQPATAAEREEQEHSTIETVLDNAFVRRHISRLGERARRLDAAAIAATFRVANVNLSALEINIFGAQHQTFQ